MMASGTRISSSVLLNAFSVVLGAGHGHIALGVLLLVHIVALSVTGALAWWLSGYDTKLTHDDPKHDLLRRGVRCAVTLVLMEVALSGLLRWLVTGDFTGGLLYILLVVPLALTWTGCLSEFFARGFQRLVDPQDARPAELGADVRVLDQLAHLVRQGKREEAIRLCHQLRESGEASDLALETMLTRLGADPAVARGNRPAQSKPLAEAERLRAQGQFAQAEVKLAALLKQEPSNQAATLMLMRLYAQDLHRPDQAEAVLRGIAQQRFVPPAFIDYARRSLTEWSQPQPQPGHAGPAGQPPQVASVPPDPANPTVPPAGASVDDLLAQGYFGSAIELLEKGLQERPKDFVLWLKLAEAQAVHCGNLSSARKLIERVQINPAFTPEQVQQARAKLKEWTARQASL